MSRRGLREMALEAALRSCAAEWRKQSEDRRRTSSTRMALERNATQLELLLSSDTETLERRMLRRMRGPS